MTPLRRRSDCIELTKRFGNFTAVDDVSFSVPRGRFSILGPSGCSKTTIMRMVPNSRRPRVTS